MKSNFKRNLLISSTISLVVLVISSTASYISIKNLLESVTSVNETQEILHNVNEGEAILTDAQTSMRGFLITGNEEFVDMYKKAELESSRYFNKLDELTSDNPSQ